MRDFFQFGGIEGKSWAEADRKKLGRDKRHKGGMLK